MLWLSGFPFPDGNNKVYIALLGRPIRESPDQRLLAATRSLTQLVTPFVSPQAEISPRQRGRIEFY